MTETKEAEIISEAIRVQFPRPAERWAFKGYVEWPHGSGNKAGTVWTHRLIPHLNVLRSLSTTGDGTKWVHVSVAHPKRLPTWEELSKAKNDFIGEDREAYQVLASNEDHINAHAYCLHLWAPLDGQRRVANLQDLTNEVAL
jgi:hypothetical protein